MTTAAWLFYLLEVDSLDLDIFRFKIKGHSSINRIYIEQHLTLILLANFNFVGFQTKQIRPQEYFMPKVFKIGQSHKWNFASLRFHQIKTQMITIVMKKAVYLSRPLLEAGFVLFSFSRQLKYLSQVISLVCK
jgi:hypothetical protein